MEKGTYGVKGLLPSSTGCSTGFDYLASKIPTRASLLCRIICSREFVGPAQPAQDDAILQSAQSGNLSGHTPWRALRPVSIRSSVRR